MRITIIIVAAFLLHPAVLTAQQTDEGDKLFRDCRNKDFLDADPQGAIPLCERVVREHFTNRPLLAKARLELGHLYEAIGNLSKTRENYNELCKMSDQAEKIRTEGCSRLDGLPAVLELRKERYMSVQVISIIGLIAIFLTATVLPVNMGALALGGAFIVGTAFVGESAKDIIGGFPGDLFLILVGVTLLFAIAKDNGTIDWLVNISVKAVGGRIAAMPWIMFAVTALLTSVGAVGPAAVAIIAPIGMGFALRHKIHPVLMGLMIINGSSAGGFSPLGIFGSIVNQGLERNHLAGNPLLLYMSSMLFNIALCGVGFVLFGGRALIGKRDRGISVSELQGDGGIGRGAVAPAPGAAAAVSRAAAPTTTLATTLDRHRVLTLIGLAGLVVGALLFKLDPGFMAITVAAVLSLAAPSLTKNAVNKVAWLTVLLICGIVTYVALMQRIGTIDYLGNSVSRIGAPLLAAVLICYIAGIVSAFASTTGILGALIPLAVPFLLNGEVGVVGMIIALSISASVVDSSPFSTSGALVVASAPADETDRVFRQLVTWGFSMVAIAPFVTWLIFVFPGWR